VAEAFTVNANGGQIVMTRISRRLIVSFTVAAMTLPVGQAIAQGVFPAPLPGQAGAPASNALPFPPVNGGPPLAGGSSDACMNGFIPLREEAVERGKLIKAASERHAPPGEACKLIANFAQSEIKMIKYIEANSGSRGISPQIADQLKTGHKNAEAMQIKVCRVAQEAQARRPSLNEMLGPQRREPAGPVGDFEMFGDRYGHRYGPY
jgi:hypothetical protein